MTYRVNELFLTVQGEGANVGRPAVFLRFSGCNLWSGVEAERASSVCTFCDTDFVAAEEHESPDSLADEVLAAWVAGPGNKLVVLTGGEPALQADQALVSALNGRGFEVAVETNGTLPLPHVNWVCVSPKTPTLRVRSGNELKLVYPQNRLAPEMFAALDFDRFWLSPMDGPDLRRNTELAYEYCLSHPQWRLNTQVHKLIGVR